jgi:hypothetical protein
VNAALASNGRQSQVRSNDLKVFKKEKRGIAMIPRLFLL